MQTRYKRISVPICLLFLFSCTPTYTYFTKALYDEYKWQEEDLVRIQFFVSDNIVLSRTLKDGESVIEGGSIRIRDGKRVEQITIHAGTPGVLVFMPDVDRFAVSFEPADNEAYLMFGPNPEHNERFSLLAQEWERDFGIIHYKGEEFVVDASSAYASLMVDIQKFDDSQLVTHKVSGRTITE